MNTTNTRASPLARKLRKEAFWAERTLWEILRDGRLNGRAFNRQHIFHHEKDGMKVVFIADFYCPSEGLVLSLDGDIRRSPQGIDLLRDEILYENGLRMLRIRQDEIHQMDRLKQKIENLFRPKAESSLLI